MNIVQLKKGSGKSMISILYSIKKNYPIIVPDDSGMLLISELFLKMKNQLKLFKEGDLPPKVYSWREVNKHPDLIKNYEGIIIDNLDILLSEILGINSDNILITTR